MTADEDVELTRKDLVGLLAAAFTAKEDRDAAGRRYDQMARLFRDYLAANTDDVLYDGESHVEARLSRPPSVTDYDLDECPFALLEELHKARLLRVDNKAAAALPPGRLRDEVLRLRRIGEGTPRLTLEKRA